MTAKENIQKLNIKVKPAYLDQYKLEKMKKDKTLYQAICIVSILLESFMLVSSAARSGYGLFVGKELDYAIMYVVMLVVNILLYLHFSNKKNGNYVSRLSEVFYINFMLLWNIGIVFLDQNIYPNVTTYIMTIFAIAVLGTSTISVVISSYGISFVIFVICLPYFQSSEQIRYTEYINSFISIVVSILAFILSNNIKIKDFNNRMVILEKNRELDEISKRLIDANERLKEQAYTDQLTGLLNRHYFTSAVENEFKYSDEKAVPLCLAIFDLDHFKRVNDNWGHPIGDEVLKRCAHIAKQFMRESDRLARLGGEEFIILLHDTSLEEGFKICERIRIALAEENHPVVGNVTVSIGVAQRNEFETYSSLYRRTDLALYQAKEQGRNRVVESTQEYEIPYISAKFRWNDEWASGNTKIDEQHQLLFELSNSIMNDLFGSQKKIAIEKLKKLRDHLEFHFSYEDQLLENVAYIEWEEHRDIHRRLLEKIDGLVHSFSNGVINDSSIFTFIVDDVVTEHLIKEDTKFFSYIKDNNYDNM